MLAIRNAAIGGLIALTIVMATMFGLTWDQYVYATALNTALIAGFSFGVIAAYVTLFGIAVAAHDNR